MINHALIARYLVQELSTEYRFCQTFDHIWNAIFWESRSTKEPQYQIYPWQWCVTCRKTIAVTSVDPFTPTCARCNLHRQETYLLVSRLNLYFRYMAPENNIAIREAMLRYEQLRETFRHLDSSKPSFLRDAYSQLEQSVSKSSVEQVQKEFDDNSYYEWPCLGQNFTDSDRGKETNNIGDSNSGGSNHSKSPAVQDLMRRLEWKKRMRRLSQKGS